MLWYFLEWSIVSSRQAFFVQYNLVSNLLLDRKVFCIATVKKSSFKKGLNFRCFFRAEVYSGESLENSRNSQKPDSAVFLVTL